MASAKEVRTKIASIKNTQKITKAMEMVAASKMRKAQERMKAARPYAEKIRNVIAHLGHANPEYKHSYLGEREEIKRVGVIIISSDRGLCGGLNSNLFRATLNRMKEWDEFRPPRKPRSLKSWAVVFAWHLLSIVNWQLSPSSRQILMMRRVHSWNAVSA